MATIEKEVKEEILGKVKSGVRVQEVAGLYGITIQTIYSWLKEKVGEVSKTEHTRLKRENRQLKELVGALTMDLARHKKSSLATEYSKDMGNKAQLARDMGYHDSLCTTAGRGAPIVPYHTSVSDFTYLRYRSPYYYLATFMDRTIRYYNRKRIHTALKTSSYGFRQRF